MTAPCRRLLLDHVAALHDPLRGLAAEVDRLERWSACLVERLTGGQRLLVAGNGGSAAQAQHLTAELVGRYCEERPPFSAIALHAETSAVTAIVNDYGADEVFARQVRAHGRPGDVLLALSTSGRSPNLLAAAAVARPLGIDVWALTGPAPNPLAAAAGEALAVAAPSTATVQEVHQVAVHLLCAGFDAHLAAGVRPDREGPRRLDAGRDGGRDGGRGAADLPSRVAAPARVVGW